MNQYKCKECGTMYSTSADTPPPSPKWDDGHVCVMTPYVEVSVRLGIPDYIITKEEYEQDENHDIPANAYFIGYELEDGTECDEDGSPLEKE